jgi:hypothetical protein
MVQLNFPVRDVMRRTADNLRTIEALKRQGDDSVWEVTQLVNSFAGLVLHPWERWDEKLKAIRLDSPEGAKWPRLVAEHPGDEQVLFVGQLVRLVRNAFAHGNIIFHEDDGGEIRELQIWNSDQGLRTWSSRVSIETLHSLLDAMIEETGSFDDPKQRTMPPHKSELPKVKNPQCPKCGRTVKRGHALYEGLVAGSAGS